MGKFFENIQHEVEKVCLTGTERSYLRRVILSHIKEPLRTPSEATTGHSVFPFLRRFSHFPKIIPLSLVAILVVGVGTSSAAERALPGDFLYPLKVSVNEKVKLAVAFSAEARAVAEVRLMERRVSEAAELAAAGRLSPETSADISRRFDEGAMKLADNLERLKEEGDFPAAATTLKRFTERMDVERGILERVAEDRKEAILDALPIINRANKVSRAAAALRESVDARIAIETVAISSAPSAAAERIGETEEKVKEVKSFRAAEEKRLNRNAKREVEEKILRADGRAAKAGKKFERGDSDKILSEALESRAAAEEVRRQIEVEIRAKTLLKKYKKEEGRDDNNEKRIASTSRAEVWRGERKDREEEYLEKLREQNVQFEKHIDAEVRSKEEDRLHKEDVVEPTGNIQLDTSVELDL